MVSTKYMYVECECVYSIEGITVKGDSLYSPHYFPHRFLLLLILIFSVSSPCTFLSCVWTCVYARVYVCLCTLRRPMSFAEVASTCLVFFTTGVWLHLC